MTTSRLSLAAAFLIGLTLVPTVLHSYVDLKVDDGFTARAIAPRLADWSSQPTERTAGWVKRTLDSDDWSERNYRNPEGGNVRFFVARSYDVKRLYHHPELAVAYGFDLQDRGVEFLAAMKDVPVHVLRAPNPQDEGLALYAMLYDGAFVDNPYTFQLRTAGALLFSPRRAMTLFFAHDQTAAAAMSIDNSAAARVLVAGIRSFQSQLPHADQ